MLYIQPNVTQSDAVERYFKTGMIPPHISQQTSIPRPGIAKQTSILQSSVSQPSGISQFDTFQSNTTNSGSVHPNIMNSNSIHSCLLQPNTLQPQIFDKCSNCTMNVVGKGVVKAEPDRVTIVLGVVTENMQLEIAQSENNDKMSEVIESLIKMGIAEEDIKTQTYQIQPQYDYVNNEQVFRGYRVVNEVSVGIEEINIAGSVIDEAVRSGANTVGNIEFHISNPQIYYTKAINLALSDAISKAESIGAKMNVYVNPIPLRITERTPPVDAPITYMSMQATGASAPIYPGINEITAILEAEFEFSCSRN